MAFPWRFFGDDWLPFWIASDMRPRSSKVSTRFWCLGEAGNGKTGSHSFFGSKTMVFPAGFPKNHGSLAKKTWFPFSKFEVSRCPAASWPLLGEDATATADVREGIE